MATEHHPLYASYLLSRRLEEAWLPPCPDESQVYGHEPLPFDAFFAGMEVIGHPMKRRFLDVGCGIGTKLELARLLGYNDVTGVEFRPQYAAIARRICPEATVIEADAFRWDGFGDYDVVYAYRPCVSDELEDRFERHVIGHLRPGTLLFLPMRQSLVGEHLGSNVWRV